MAQLGILVAFFRFTVDLLLIMGTNRLCGHKTRMLPACLAASLGGVQAGICTISGFAFLGQIHWRGIFLLLSSWIAFGAGGAILRRGALFALLELAVGQVATGKIGPFLLAVACVMVLCLTDSAGQLFPRRTAQVIITHGGKEVALTALLDTGNTLTDPVTGAQVLVVDSAVGEALLGFSAEALARPLETMATCSVPGLRLIPYHSVGQPAGLLLGIRPHQICIDGVCTQQIVAFCPHSLGDGHSFQALAGGLV